MKRFLALVFSALMLITGLLFPSNIAGTSWELKAWSMSSVDPSDYTMTLSFDKHAFSGRSAVNHYGGGYRTIGGRVWLTDMYTTLMAGSPEDMHAERVYMELLGQAKKFTVSDTELILLDNNGNQLLIFAPIPE